MSLTTVASGTTTPSGTTETTLYTATASTPTTYMLGVDAGALVATEVLFVRIYSVLLSGGTERLAYFGSFISGSDPDPQLYSVPVPITTSATIRCTVQQKNGTARALPWILYSL